MKFKKITTIILLICCFTLTTAQKKKTSKSPPPKVKTLPPPTVEEQSIPNQIEYLKLMPDYERKETPKVLEKLNINPDAKKCACNDVALLTKDKFGEGLLTQDYGLKEKIKNVKTIEKRDTLVGYSETLSKGNTIEMQFLENGHLSTYLMKNISNKNLNGKSVFHYTTSNQITFIEAFYGDNVQPIAKYIFQYDQWGFNGTLLESQLQKKVYKQIFECFKTENEFYGIKKQPDEENEREENELMVFNTKNQLVKKQAITNYKQNTTENKTTAYVYDDSGLMIEEQFLKKDGTVRSYLRHQYNQQGDIIKSTYKNGDYIVYDYKYDAQNNWIWKRKTEYEKSRFGSEMEITERLTWDRTIEYY